MNENIEKAAGGGDIFIWMAVFGILVIIVGYLAYINKDAQR